MKEKQKNQKSKKPIILGLLLLLLISALVLGFDYYKVLQSRVYIEKSEINAPIISLSPIVTGELKRVLVSEGDTVKKDMIIAQVGNNSIKAKSDGVIISVKNTIGKVFTTQDFVAQMIDPEEFRVIGTLDEDKGLNYIKLGQKVTFTVDTFDKKKYYGIVDSIALTSRQSDIVFSISDKREQKQFEVKVKYDVEAYPELKNGMSARMWIYK